MSATLDAGKFQIYFDNCPLLTIPGRTSLLINSEDFESISEQSVWVTKLPELAPDPC